MCSSSPRDYLSRDLTARTLLDVHALSRAPSVSSRTIGCMSSTRRNTPTLWPATDATSSQSVSGSRKPADAAGARMRGQAVIGPNDKTCLSTSNRAGRFLCNVKIGILHLSDIHLKADQNAVVAKVDGLRGVLEAHRADLEACVVVFSGDVAFSGKRLEYAAALAADQIAYQRAKGGTTSAEWDGQCRQALVEFAPDLAITSRTRAGAERSWRLSELLPYPFTPASLQHP